MRMGDVTIYSLRWPGTQIAKRTHMVSVERTPMINMWIFT